MAVELKKSGMDVKDKHKIAVYYGRHSSWSVEVLLLHHQKIQIRSDEVVWVCAPARLDFAGGWSDTQPYCLEHGGSVLNAAVKLNGQYPIQGLPLTKVRG